MVIQAALQQSYADPQMTFEASDHGEVVLAGLTKLREQEQLFDVVFIVDNERLSAHRVVLASCSDYFRAMFTDGLLECKLDEIPMNGVTATGMRNLIDFAYSSKIDINADNVEDVLCAANHIQLTPVIDACVNFMKSHIVLSNCIDLLSVAELFTLHDLALFVYKYISKHLSALAICREFHKLSENQLKRLLHLNYPVDCTESEVLSAVIGWIVHHHGHSPDYGIKYLSKVNFNSISSTDVELLSNAVDLHEIVKNDSNELGLKSLLDKVSSAPTEVSGLTNVRGYKECVVVCGGFRPEIGMNNEIHCYDSENNSMQHLTSVPHVEQCNFGMTVMNNELYVLGGCYNNAHMEEIIHNYGFCFSPISQTWRIIPPMLVERCRFYLGGVGNKLYAVGGDPAASLDTADFAPCECFDVETKQWKPISPLPGNRMEHAGTTMDGNVYISGGLQDAEGPVFNTFFKYDTQVDLWLQLPSMLCARADHSMVSYDGKIYIIGGWLEDTITHQRIMVSDIDCFDFKSGSWTTIATLNSPRLYASYALSGSKIVMIGGWLNGDCKKKSSSVEVFDLQSLEWELKSNASETNSQSQEIWEHASCSLYVPGHALREPVLELN